MKKERVFSVFLALLLGLLLFAKDGSSFPNLLESSAAEPLTFPEVISEEEQVQNCYVARLNALEEDLNTLVFANADGNYVMRLFQHPVKYLDSNGEVQDITLEIEEAGNGSFQTADNSIVTTFSRRLEDGIRLRDSQVDIVMKPVLPQAVLAQSASAAKADANVFAELAETRKEVTYDYGKVSYEYALTYTGFKEEIIVEEYTNVTDYSFELYTNGLTLKEVQGELYLFDGETAAATISDVIVFTADERNNRAFKLRYDVVEESQKYVLTIHLDSEYLKDEKTAYPIRIDPTIEINYANSSSGIVDVTIAKNTTFSINSGSLYVGKRASEGVCRILMRFPGLNLGMFANSSQILKASVEMRDLMCESTEMAVECYVFNGNIWGSSNCSWNTVNAANYSNMQDRKLISYSNGTTQTIAHRYSFDITDAVIGWKKGTYNQSKGIIFLALPSVEQATSNTNKTFASYNRSAYQPSLSVVYLNPFLENSRDMSAYIDATSQDSLQNRANCYGFALKMYYASDDYVEEGATWYKQQPGEFASKGYLSQKNNYKTLENMYINKMQAGGLTIDFMMELIEADMLTMGYHVLSTAKYTSSAQIPSAGNTNKRLILLVIHNGDYHFYMQNSNDTWSHKPGANTARSVCNDHAVTLTNANILQHMQEGPPTSALDYDKDYLFFYVDKSAQIDYGHLYGHGNHSYTEIDECDQAGGTQSTAERIQDSSTAQYGRFDGKDDVDYFAFRAESTGNKTFQFELSTREAAVVNIFCLSEPSPIAWQYFSSGFGSIVFPMVKDEVYYLCIDYTGQSTYSAQRKYVYFLLK